MSNSLFFDLRGKTALVTGGARGLGRASAEALAMSGANVAIVDLNEPIGQRTAEALKKYDVDTFFVRCDVADQAQIQAMTEAVVERFGRLDIGVNNAAITVRAAAEDLSRSDWDRVLGVDLTGVFLCAQAQARQMIKRSPPDGKIINIASVSGLIAAYNVAYNTAKAGVIHLTHSLAVEWARYNINVNCISPNWVMTPAMMSTPEDLRARMRQLTPLGHIQRPEDIQGAIIYLASSASNFVTGHNLVIDGGHTLNTWLDTHERAAAPRVSPEQETIETLKDLQPVDTAGSAEGSLR